MMALDILRLGTSRTNCYIVRGAGAKSCLLIDPGDEAETVLARVDALGLTVEAIALTHGHFDHVGAVERIFAAAHCHVWMHEADYDMPRDEMRAFLFPLANTKAVPFSFYRDGDVLRAANLTFTVLETPGHTRGGVCLMCENALFTGDTLFHNTCGRTDLPESSPDAMRASLERLKHLDFSGDFYPGHGVGGHFPEEKQTNPYLRGDV